MFDSEIITDLSFGLFPPPELKVLQPFSTESLNTFKHVSPMHVLHEYYDKLNVAYFTDATPKDVDFNLDVTTMSLNPENLIQLTRIRSSSLNQVRKLCRKHIPSNFYLYVSYLHLSSGKSIAQTGYEVLAYRPNTKNLWENVTLDNWVVNTGSASAHRMVDRYITLYTDWHHAQAALGIAFTESLYWHADFKLTPVQPAIRLPIDATGVTELFKDRDKSLNGRREALKTWVSEHWRRQPSKDTEILIREYLRGANKFKWRGYSVELQPSQSDLKHLDRIKKEPKSYRLAP